VFTRVTEEAREHRPGDSPSILGSVEINKEKKNQKKSAERTKCSGKKKARPSGRNRKKKSLEQGNGRRQTNK
jgi:hypothetical protein